MGRHPFVMNSGVEIAYASAFTVLCLVSATIYSLLNRAYTYWDKRNVKGPRASYFIGTWKGFAQKFLGYEDLANCKIFGKVWGSYDGFTPNLIVSDPAMIKEILVQHADKFQDVRFTLASSVILKNSLLYLCGGEKPEVQSLTSYLLDRPKLDKIISKLEDSVQVLVKLVSKQEENGSAVQITSCVNDFINFAVAFVIFGIDLESDSQVKETFLKNLEETVITKNPDSLSSLLPYLYPNKFRNNWICSEEALKYFVKLGLSGITESSSKEGSGDRKPFSLIDIMEEAAKEEKKLSKPAEEIENLILTDDVIVSKCIASLISLRNATRTIVTMGIDVLARNKEIQDRLYKEVKTYKSQKIKYDEIQNLGYLDKVIKEIMRLYPFEFRLERIATEPVKIGEVEVEKNIKVSIPLFALHRAEANYSEPEDFNPERFNEHVIEKQNPFTYLPFGQAGLNGSDFSLQVAVLASKIAILRLIENFNFSKVPETTSHSLFVKGFTRVPVPQNLKLFVEKRV